MIITSSIEKDLNATLSGFFEAVEPEPSEALFIAKSKLKDAKNFFVISTVIAAAISAFAFLSFC